MAGWRAAQQYGAENNIMMMMMLTTSDSGDEEQRFYRMSEWVDNATMSRRGSTSKLLTVIIITEPSGIELY